MSPNVHVAVPLDVVVAVHSFVEPAENTTVRPTAGLSAGP